MLEPIVADVLSVPGIAHGFFTRKGGVSSGIYESLNCGLGSKDERAAVLQNRDRVARHLGAAPGSVVTLYQIHSDVAVAVDRPVPFESLPKADALVTRTPGVVIGALAADCAPVLFVDPAAKVVGAAHAGWRGAVGGILESTLAAMVRLGAEQGRISACVGPCIGQQAYEVGPEFEADLLARDSENARFFVRASAGGRPHFDLPGYVEARLRNARLAAVERRTPCTFESESLFSYRRSQRHRQPDYGRQISAIVVS
jgi:YfiH family protein